MQSCFSSFSVWQWKTVTASAFALHLGKNKLNSGCFLSAKHERSEFAQVFEGLLTEPGREGAAALPSCRSALDFGE